MTPRYVSSELRESYTLYCYLLSWWNEGQINGYHAHHFFRTQACLRRTLFRPIPPPSDPSALAAALSSRGVVATHRVVKSAPRAEVHGFVLDGRHSSQAGAGRSHLFRDCDTLAFRGYPIKRRLTETDGNFITAPCAVTSNTYNSTACGAFMGDPTDALETSATGNSSLRYDSMANLYIYN